MNHMTEKAIERLLIEIQSSEEELQTWQAQVEQSKKELLDLLEKHNISSTEQEVQGESVKVTVVRPTRLEIDEDGLEQELTDSLWRLVTKVVLDKKALESAVAKGKIEPQTISKHSKEVATKPYLRITR